MAYENQRTYNDLPYKEGGQHPQQHPDLDAHSQRLCLAMPFVLGVERFNGRPQIDLSPLPYDAEFDPLPFSEFPVRPSLYPIAVESMGQYQEWSDSNSAMKVEFSTVESSGARSNPAPTPEQYGDWFAYDEYRLSFIGARGSTYDA